jgi:hypothetical protein
MVHNESASLPSSPWGPALDKYERAVAARSAALAADGYRRLLDQALIIREEMARLPRADHKAELHDAIGLLHAGKARMEALTP